MTYQSQQTSGNAEPAPRRLLRSRSDRHLGGVCGGLAEYFEADPTVVRLAVVVGSLLTGIGLILYPLAWLVVPREPDHRWFDYSTRFGTDGPGYPSPPRQTESGPRYRADTPTQILLSILAVLLLVSIVGADWIFSSVVLVAGGLWLLSQRPDTQTSSKDRSSNPTAAARAGVGANPFDSPPASPLTTQGPNSSDPVHGPKPEDTDSPHGEHESNSASAAGPRDPAQMSDDELLAAAESFSGPFSDPDPQGPPPPPGGGHHQAWATHPGYPRPTGPAGHGGSIGWAQPSAGRGRCTGRSRRTLVLTVIFGSAAAIWLVVAGATASLAAPKALGIAAIVLGSGVTLAALIGARPRLLLAMSLLAAALIMPAHYAGDAFGTGIGERRITPTAGPSPTSPTGPHQHALQDEYSFGFGSLTVDLTQVPIEDLDGQTVTVDHGVGEVIVILPSEIGGTVSADIAGAGEITIEQSGGPATSLDGVRVRTGDIALNGTTGELELRVELFAGELTVETQ